MQETRHKASEEKASSGSSPWFVQEVVEEVQLNPGQRGEDSNQIQQTIKHTEWGGGAHGVAGVPQPHHEPVEILVVRKVIIGTCWLLPRIFATNYRLFHVRLWNCDSGLPNRIWIRPLNKKVQIERQTGHLPNRLCDYFGDLYFYNTEQSTVF